MWKNLNLVKDLGKFYYSCNFSVSSKIYCLRSFVPPLYSEEVKIQILDFGRWRLAEDHTQQVSDRVRAKTQISREWSSTESVGVCVWMAKVEPPLFTSLFIFLVP